MIDPPVFFPGCYKITTVFSHAQTVVLCVGCSTVLCQPTGGKARLTEGKGALPPPPPSLFFPGFHQFVTPSNIIPHLDGACVCVVEVCSSTAKHLDCRFHGLPGSFCCEIDLSQQKGGARSLVSPFRRRRTKPCFVPGCAAFTTV